MNMNIKDNVTINFDGKSLQATKGCRLSSVLNIEKLCGGHGICGKCKIIATGELSPLCEEEKMRLTESEKTAGVRLACHTYALGDCVVKSLQNHEHTQILTKGEKTEFTLLPMFSQYGVAVDIGTTTVAARLYNVKGEALAEAAAINGQEIFGGDVISRIEAAMSGKRQELSRIILSCIDDLIIALCNKASVSSPEIDGMVITGNTAMLHFLMECDASPLSKAPFFADRLFGEQLTAKKLGLKSVDENTSVYLPRCISAFVGADTVCALTATQTLWEKECSLLVDIGTNGEMALCCDGEITVCSTAAGPAFEGVGIACGMRGEEGAVDKVFYKNGKLCYHTIGEIEPIGICGSGIIDAVAVMLENGIIDSTGYMEDNFNISKNVYITDKDIRMVQLAKSAIAAGISTLLESKKAESSLSQMLIAGGFGNYLNVENACEIGLLPREYKDKTKAVGNAALEGASMLLLSREKIKQSEDMAEKVQVLPLHNNPQFSQKYMENMLF